MEVIVTLKIIHKADREKYVNYGATVNLTSAPPAPLPSNFFLKYRYPFIHENINKIKNE